MDPDLCSILLPAYNAEQYLRAAVDSALARTYPRFEIVLVNDGSSDATDRIASEYASRPEVRYFAQENRGLAGARNRALAESRGGWIALLDADVWTPNRLEHCFEFIGADPRRTWITTDLFILDDDEATTTRYYEVRANGFATTDQLKAIAERNFVSIAAVIRRDLFERHGVFDESLRRAEDYDLWIRFLLAGENVTLLNEPLGWYRRHASSLSADGDAQWQAHLAVLELHWRELCARGASPPGNVCYELALRALERGDHDGARRLAKLARQAEPRGRIRWRYEASIYARLLNRRRSANVLETTRD